jgi:hypothetical protein
LRCAPESWFVAPAAGRGGASLSSGARPTLGEWPLRAPLRVSSHEISRTRRVAGSIEQLSFELTASALAQQERSLSGLRTCAGTILAAASIAGSFLATGISHSSPDSWGVLATVAFVACLGCAIWVLTPHKLVFAFHGAALLTLSDHGGPRALPDGYRTAGSWIEPHLQSNRRTITGLSKWLTASCVLLAVELVLWILSVAS